MLEGKGSTVHEFELMKKNTRTVKKVAKRPAQAPPPREYTAEEIEKDAREYAKSLQEQFRAALPNLPVRISPSLLSEALLLPLDDEEAMLQAVFNRKSIRLDYCSISTLSPGVELVSHVTRLYLSHNNIVDLSPISCCESLESLVVSNNRVVEISGVARLGKLAYLDVSNNRIALLPAPQPDSIPAAEPPTDTHAAAGADPSSAPVDGSVGDLSPSRPAEATHSLPRVLPPCLLHLAMGGNPCCRDVSEEEVRTAAVAAAPRLLTLDGVVCGRTTGATVGDVLGGWKSLLEGGEGDVEGGSEGGGPRAGRGVTGVEAEGGGDSDGDSYGWSDEGSGDDDDVGGEGSPSAEEARRGGSRGDEGHARGGGGEGGLNGVKSAAERARAQLESTLQRFVARGATESAALDDDEATLKWLAERRARRSVALASLGAVGGGGATVDDGAVEGSGVGESVRSGRSRGGVTVRGGGGRSGTGGGAAQSLRSLRSGVSQLVSERSGFDNDVLRVLLKGATGLGEGDGDGDGSEGESDGGVTDLGTLAGADIVGDANSVVGSVTSGVGGVASLPRRSGGPRLASSRPGTAKGPSEGSGGVSTRKDSVGGEAPSLEALLREDDSVSAPLPAASLPSTAVSVPIGTTSRPSTARRPLTSNLRKPDAVESAGAAAVAAATKRRVRMCEEAEVALQKVGLGENDVNARDEGEGDTHGDSGGCGACADEDADADVADLSAAADAAAAADPAPAVDEEGEWWARPRSGRGVKSGAEGGGPSERGSKPGSAKSATGSGGSGASRHASRAGLDVDATHAAEGDGVGIAPRRPLSGDGGYAGVYKDLDVDELLSAADRVVTAGVPDFMPSARLQSRLFEIGDLEGSGGKDRALREVNQMDHFEDGSVGKGNGTVKVRAPGGAEDGGEEGGESDPDACVEAGWVGPVVSRPGTAPSRPVTARRAVGYVLGEATRGDLSSEAAHLLHHKADLAMLHTQSHAERLQRKTERTQGEGAAERKARFEAEMEAAERRFRDMNTSLLGALASAAVLASNAPDRAEKRAAAVAAGSERG